MSGDVLRDYIAIRDADDPDLARALIENRRLRAENSAQGTQVRQLTAQNRAQAAEIRAQANEIGRLRGAGGNA